jgi:hypothetical protein
MPSISYVSTLLRTSSPTSGGPLAPKRLCFLKTRPLEILIFIFIFYEHLPRHVRDLVKNHHWTPVVQPFSKFTAPPLRALLSERQGDGLTTIAVGHCIDDTKGSERSMCRKGRKGSGSE